MNHLCITLATRGRPQRVLDTVSRSIMHWTNPNTRLVVQADEDDPATVIAVQDAIKNKWGHRVLIDVKPREDTIAAKWNRAYRDPHCAHRELFLVAADDDPYVTPGYDQKLLDAGKRFPDGIGMVYGRMANASFSGAVCPTRGFCDLLGHIFPEYFPYWFVDHWTDDLARLIGRISFADIATDQSNVGKTQELREPAWWSTFFDAGYLKRRAIARSIIDAPGFQEAEWRKDILRTHYPLIEYRSRWINDNVRLQAKQLEGWSGLTTAEPRYQRIRTAAVATLEHFLNDFGMDKAEADAWRRYLTPPTSVPGLQRVG